MSRRLRLRLLEENWIAYGAAKLPEDRIIEVSEAEAAEFLHQRGMHRRVEILGWIDDRNERENSTEISD